MAQREQQPRAGDVGAPGDRIEAAELRQPARHQRFGHARRSLGIGGMACEIAQPLPAIRPVVPRRRGPRVGKVQLARHGGMAGMDHSPGDQPFADRRIAGPRVLRHAEQFQRIATAQAHPVQRRLVQRRRDPRRQAFAQRQAAVAGDT